MPSFTTPVQHRILRQNIKPHHEHDCEQCTFLGTIMGVQHIPGVGTPVDLYVCDKQMFGGRTFIQRFSSAMSDNSSMPLFNLLQLPNDQYIREPLFRRFGLAVNLQVARDILQETYLPHEWAEKA